MKTLFMSLLLKEKWSKSITERLGKQFEPLGNIVAEFLSEVTKDYIENKLADNHFIKEFESSNKYSYEQRLSEILFYLRLQEDGFHISSKDEGPDFKAKKHNQTYWFEVVTPEPNKESVPFIHDINSHLFPNGSKQASNAMRNLIRISSVIKDKNEKFIKYKENGIIKENEPCIIVINDSLLQPFNRSMIGLTHEIEKGKSGLPLAIEALLGCGACIWHTDNEIKQSEILRTVRRKITKDNGSVIQTDNFLTGTYDNVSAIFTLTLREEFVISQLMYGIKYNRGILVHNEKSKVSLSKNIISAKNYFFEDIKNYFYPSKENPITSFTVKTLMAQYNDFIIDYNAFVKKFKTKAMKEK